MLLNNPYVSGMLPVISLRLTSNSLIFAKPSDISSGSGPSKSLLVNSIHSICVKLLIDVGITPVKSLVSKNSFFNFVQFPIEIGILPVKSLLFR